MFTIKKVTKYSRIRIIKNSLVNSRIFVPTRGYTESIKAIVVAMREAQVTRLITMTSWWSESELPEGDEQN